MTKQTLLIVALLCTPTLHGLEPEREEEETVCKELMETLIDGIAACFPPSEGSCTIQ